MYLQKLESLRYIFAADYMCSSANFRAILSWTQNPLDAEPKTDFNAQ